MTAPILCLNCGKAKSEHTAAVAGDPFCSAGVFTDKRWLNPTPVEDSAADQIAWLETNDDGMTGWAVEFARQIRSGAWRTAAEFTAIVDELYASAKNWLEAAINDADRRFTATPTTWVFGVAHVKDFELFEWDFCTPTKYVHPEDAPLHVCWINWDTNRSDAELRDVLGQALSVLMRELGMEWPQGDARPAVKP
jgi:hypothetical protein